MRRLLIDSGYSEEVIRARMGIDGLHKSLGMRSTSPADDAVELLIQVFLLCEAVQEDHARKLLPEGALELLAALGLLENAPEGRVAATVSLYPIDGVYVVSDKNQNSEQDRLESVAPRVFSAVTPQTSEFLAMLPEDPCPAFLEVCAGAGAAALLAASRYAVQSFAFDISDRSTHFAEFSRRLNGLSNLTVLQGDLYAPAGRRTFDRIVAHPPYVPSLRSEQLYRDGGVDGEWLTRRIVEGLPNYLHPGGDFYCLCLMAEVIGEPVYQRLRRWLRESESEFDLLVVVRRTADPVRLIFDNWSLRYAQPGDLQRWQTVLRKQRIEGFVQVSILLQRHTGQAALVTLMRREGPECSTVDARQLLRWEQRVARDGAAACVEHLVPRAAQQVAITRREVLQEGKRSVPLYSYAVESPFQFEYQGAPWIADLLTRAQGAATVRDLYSAAPLEGVEWEEFARVAAELISGGLLRVPA